MKKTLSIEGMSCGHCVQHVKTTLEGIDGISQVTVDLDSKSAEIEVSEDVSDAVIEAAISEAGYTLVSIG
ncbi:MAG: heavy-metal-associated domain-containing protein [Clostridia bacterium]|nr:heavy-metal-associated domain-containing protein [Clostridia bacterium]